FSGVLFTSVRGDSATVLRQKIANLLVKDAVEPVPPAEMKKRFYSPYFIVPKKGSGLRPILDLRVLNRALHRLPFKMLTVRHMLTCVQQQDWFVAIDLKDAYFHVSILPRHRSFLRFAFEGRAYQYKVLPFVLSLSPRVFTKVAEAALAPLRKQGIRILNYLDDWLILAQSQELVCEHRDQVLRHLARLGLRVSWEKVPCAEHLFSRCGVRLGHHDSAPFIRLRSVNAELLELFQAQDSDPTETISEAPGAFRICSHGHAARVTSHETASALASQPSPEIGMAPRHTSSGYHSDLSPSVQPLVGPCVSTGGSALRPSVQACCGYNRRFQDQLGLGFLDGLPSAMAHQVPRVANCALSPEEASAIDSRQAQWSTLPLQHVKSLRAVHISGHLNCAADALSRQVTFHGEWRLHPHTVQLIWNRFGEAQIDLFASHESTHCALWYSLTEAPLRTDALAHSWPIEPHCTDSVQSQGGTSSSPYGCPLLAQPDLVHGPHAASISSSLANSPEEGPSFSGAGHNLAPTPRSLEPPRLVPGWDKVEFGDLSPAVIDTITQARAPSTRQLYALKWRVFTRTHRDQGLEKRLSASTLKVYVAAVAVNHDLVDGSPLGPTERTVRALTISRAWRPLYEDSLLIALTSLKRVGDLQALSVCDECLEFGPAYSHVALRPRPGYVPKVPTTPFRDQVVNLQAFPSEGGNPALSLLCPVCALRIYLERTQSFRQSEQLFVCFGGQRKEKAVSKQRLAHWIVDAILRAYQAQDVPCLLSIRAHSTRGVAATSALAHGASLADIFRAAGWATPNTFARFYNLCMEPVLSRVFGDN
ncbi:hypothetical protein M9458_026207, partial [Cirrhinus mrigala]